MCIISCGCTSSKEQENANKISEAMDVDNPITRDGALQLVRASSGGSNNVNQIVDVWEYVNGHWTYVHDPSNNYYSPASRTTNLNYKGDCDDFAILIASYMEAMGRKARVILAYNKEGGHAYPEVLLASSKTGFDSAINQLHNRYQSCEFFNYHIENTGSGTNYWLNLDWWGERPGGPFYESDNSYYYAYYSDKSYKKVYSSEEKFVIKLSLNVEKSDNNLGHNIYDALKARI